MQITKRIPLDFGRTSEPVRVFAKQGDANSRYIEIVPLLDGVSWTIPDGVVAHFACHKPDGKYVYSEKPTIADNIITVPLTDQTLIAAGEAECDIILLSGEGEAQTRLSSQNFKLRIEYSPGAYKSLSSVDEITSLDALISLIETKLENGEFDGRGIESLTHTGTEESSIVHPDHVSDVYTVEFTDGTSVQLKIPRGARWFSGQYAGEGVNLIGTQLAMGAVSGDYFLSTVTGNVWKCVEDDGLTWYFQLCIKGEDAESSVDLTGYATEEYVKDYAQPKGDYVTDTELEASVDAALTEAKESGEFDGADGKSAYEYAVDGGYTGTEEEYSEGVNPDNIKADAESFIVDELAKRGQLKPEFAESTEWLEENGDTSLLYVLPDSYIYGYTKSEEVTTPNFTNILEGTTLHVNQRYSKSSAAYVSSTGHVSTDWLPVTKGDVVRFNVPLTAHTQSNCRLMCKTSDGTVYWADGEGDYYMPITEESNGEVTSITFGTIFNTAGDSSSGTKVTTSNITHLLAVLKVSDDTVSDEMASELVITLNEEITYTTTGGKSWQNTGHAFVPADYEDRIVDLETKAEIHDTEISELRTKIDNSQLSLIELGEIFAPAPQLPADTTDEADFNADSMTAQEIYDYLDTLCNTYPNYITKETLGKDASGKYDVNRYVLCKHYYSAWQQNNYPKMYGWVNGSTVIYSESVSPRIGDTMYSTAYVGTAYGTVTAVSNANQTRTVSGVVYKRDTAKDVEPTLVYTSVLADTAGSTVYKVNKATITTISTIDDTTLTGANGIIYTRYPMGDRDNNMKKFIVATVGANEHGPTGDPREPAVVCARMIKDLCERKHSVNAIVNYLKNNVMLVMVPIINPFGFNKGSNESSLDGYYNSNNVNINRNYDTPGWGNDTSAGGQGEYGGSEIETQYFMNTISEPDSDVAISVHCLGSVVGANKGLCHYQGNGFNSAKIQMIAEIMKANYNLKFTTYGTALPSSSAKSPSYITQAGAKGGIIEMNDYDVASDTYHSAFTMEANYTLLLECLYMWISDYEESAE